MKSHLMLLRPLQWLKNGFVFAPLFFSNNLLNQKYLLQTVVIFMAFCLISSSIYCFNDIFDVEADRAHPKKCRRPIASGAVSTQAGYIIMMLCVLFSFGLVSLSASPNRNWLYGVIALYFIMNIAYCIKLKQYAILDVTIIAVGFVLRVLAGGLTTGIWLSQWIVLMTFLLTLFLALAKRKDDYRIYEETGTRPRVSIDGYNATFINQATAIIAAVTMVCYIMYTMSDDVIRRMGTPYVYLTSGWVLAGLLRYLQNTTVYGRSGSPTKTLVKDRFIQLCIAGWLISFFIIIYSR